MSNPIKQKGILRGFLQFTKERLFQNKNRQQEQNVLDECVPLPQPPRKLGSCPNVCSRDFSYVTLKTRARVRTKSGCVTATTSTILVLGSLLRHCTPSPSTRDSFNKFFFKSLLFPACIVFL